MRFEAIPYRTGGAVFDHDSGWLACFTDDSTDAESVADSLNEKPHAARFWTWQRPLPGTLPHWLEFRRDVAAALAAATEGLWRR